MVSDIVALFQYTLYLTPIGIVSCFDPHNLHPFLLNNTLFSGLQYELKESRITQKKPLESNMNTMIMAKQNSI